jgi:hypothetical protein
VDIPCLSNMVTKHGVKKPKCNHIHVFGSEAWDHIHDEKRKALQSKSEKCIFVGYSKDVKGY